MTKRYHRWILDWTISKPPTPGGIRVFWFLLPAILWLGTGCSISLLGGPKFDPSLDWRVIPTEHFRVYFHQGETAPARDAARIAEEVHEILTRKLGWEPAEPTHLVLIDAEDAAFGGATPFPNNTIYISLTPPPAHPYPFLLRFDDWLRDVITHEYVHVLQLDMHGGFTSVMRAVFGRNPLPLFVFNGALPNIWQPAWLVEGLATYEETQTGVSDRRDGAYADMLLRMAILENRFPSLDQAGGRDAWPDDIIQYLFGARFYDYLSRRFGETVLKDLSLEYADNALPFFVGSTGRQILGQSYDSLWENWKSELKERFGRQRSALEREGISPSSPITRKGDYNLGPQMNPRTRRIAYTSINADDYPSIRVADPDSGRNELLARRNLGTTVSWSPDGRRLAFSQLEVYRNFSDYSDLYLYDGSVRRLTVGERLRDPDFHPDGNRLVCVENRPGDNHLVVLNPATGRREVLDWAEEGRVFSKPRWSPDGRFVAVETWNAGAQGIEILDTTNRTVRPLLMDRALDLSPSWSPDGSVLIFTSDRTGIYNLFAYRPGTNELFRVTNMLGGAFTPQVTPDGQEILFSSYTSRGFDLDRIPWQPENWIPVALFESDSDTETPGDPPSAPLHSGAYSAWPTVRPRFWSPILGGDESGLQVGMATGGQDVLGKHKYDLSALYGTESGRAAYLAQYMNDSFYPTIYISFLDYAILHSDLFDLPGSDDDYWERRRRMDAEVTLIRSRYRLGQSVTVGYRTEWLDGLTDLPFGVPPPNEGRLSAARVFWILNTAKTYRFSVSREDGGLILAEYERYDERLGGHLNQHRYRATGHYYQRLFGSHHVLAARLTGALSTGDTLLQRTYQVGGPDLTEELLFPDETDFFLRGYPPRLLRGRKAAIGSVEYRFPLYNIERGISTWPFFLRRLHGALFFDIGNAWDEDTTVSEFRRGVGGEVILDMVFGHILSLRLRQGVAKGLDEEGEWQTYFTGGNSF